MRLETKNNFISLIGNDPITIHNGKNRYKYRHRGGRSCWLLGWNPQLSFCGTQIGTVKARWAFCPLMLEATGVPTSIDLHLEPMVPSRARWHKDPASPQITGSSIDKIEGPDDPCCWDPSIF
jgi:hypothetical protein